MPLFDYKCNTCAHEFEFLVRHSDEVNTAGVPVNLVCPECEKSISFTKVFRYKTSFRLKGDGWYKDGYSSKKTE